ncbi:C2 domain protein [Aulographum hederae CBS 113979]|uniref:C2 domain protein n=1 Tax=Aulographum hederae CBS 113979 TaxID=1176131 RepID=A0A6G1GX68_9PEZI|nr:C2 domain protein [Aulographum hederae CBS 113979]
MSTSSARSRENRSRVNSLQQVRRVSSYGRKKNVERHEAYSYALRVAYLSYLLQPRAKRLQHVPAPAKVQRSTTSATDLMKDFSLIRDHKSTKFPHGFMKALDKSITGVLMGKEKMPGYNDALVKRSFAVFLNEFKKESFRKSVEKDRRVEDLLLIFFSNATKELQKGKAPEDDSWKLMVDRHVALFIRLLSSILKENDWAKDRPELATRLQTMEKKLLVHDQDLTAESQRNGGSGGHTIEVEVPRSYEVKDMPQVLTVQKIFRVPYDDIQAEINRNINVWTEKAALQDLKTYQTNLNLNNKKTLCSENFDFEDAYEMWKKSEAQDISQMMLAIVQSNMELAKTTTTGSLPQYKTATANGYQSPDSGYSEFGRKSSEPESDGSSYMIEQSLDMTGFSPVDDDAPYTFIPPEPRHYYRAILREALNFDIRDAELFPSEPSPDMPSVKLLSKSSTDLLSEIALRWRVPQFSRPVLFLDVIREKYSRAEIDLDTLEAAFLYVKEPQVETKKNRRMSRFVEDTISDWKKWTVTDYAMNQQSLSSIHDALLREVFELFACCYEPKPPSISKVMYILEEHIEGDELFSKSELETSQFTEMLQEELQTRAREVYQGMAAQLIPREDLEFFHVIELGKAVIKLCDKIQKRYRKTPVILGVSPLKILISEVLPTYAADASELVAHILENARHTGVELAVQDGFDMYREMVAIRTTHMEALPNIPFEFHIEEQLAEFVWRWIKMTDENIGGWVENAFRQDPFKVRTEHADNIPTDDERHSDSVIDIFRSFNQSISQIMQLNWDNDVQYAKFMTALAKAIGTGLSRYCELVEESFKKEMDRLTPEQEVAASQTRQEKWMQLAKDAWANKESVEPFQFLPESFVKLNNIEYATFQFDKLEKEMNVDACAEVIQRNATPPSQRLRKVDKYVFTIKIIEAEDLKAGDMNGLSDPYLVLGDEYQKRLAKTRVVYSSLNPRWDESVDITTTGPLNLIATAWDWDMMGDHDCLGRTSLKLDPSHFRDYLPREFWLDLDTQGRILLRVSMEGERDDIQFYFGKTFRTLKRTERDMTRSITDKLSAYIHHCLSRGALKKLISRGYTVASVTSIFKRNQIQQTPQGPTQMDITNALKPLFNYFDNNFAIMKETMTDAAMVMVMTRLWKEVLVTLEGLLVPPLSDKPSPQKPLTQQELDIVFRWLQLLFEFFHAVDEDTGIPNGIPLDILKSPKYHELQNLNFFYFDSTDNLIRTSESIASASVMRQKDLQARQLNRFSAPPLLLSPGHTFSGAAYGMPTTKRSKTIMLSRNLGTMKKAKEEKRKEAQAEPNDDNIMKILRMRPEAERYLKDRSRQKERLAAAAMAESIVRQSLQQQSGWGRADMVMR